MVKAYIISTGTELLNGDIEDSNSVFLARQLNAMGISVVGRCTAGDDKGNLKRAFDNALQCADLVISTGGLGPTFDDLTKTVVCELTGCSLQIRPQEEQRLRDFFAARKRPMPDINIKQAMFPPEAIVLKNPVGTAPGMYLDQDNKKIILMPGPPREMVYMYENEVRPLLAQNIGGELRPPLKKTIKTFGLGESQVEQLLAGLKKTTGQWIAGLRAVDGEIHIKLQFDNENGQNEGAMENLTGNIRDLLGHAVFGCDEETLTGKVAELLLDSGKTVALAESCTGGLMAKSITDLPGSSRYFWGGVNSYSNQAKMLFLGVKEETLARFGAVSKETAEEMARGILDCSGADFGLSVTGIAGPDGGTKDKPVGLVYIALAERNGCRVRELRLSGGRDFIRILSAKSAWDLLRRYLLSAQ